MKTLPLFVLLFLALLAGCSHTPVNGRTNGCGIYSTTNNTDTVFWGAQNDADTNIIQFVLLLPKAEQFSSGCDGSGAPAHDYCRLQTKASGHDWSIEAYGYPDAGISTLRLSDLTADTVTNLDLSQSRFWKISEDKQLLPLDQLDPQIRFQILQDSRASFKSLYP